MKTTRQQPKCELCQTHDQKTKELVGQLFSPDEQTYLTMMVASTIQFRTQALGKIPEGDINRLMVQRDLDFSSCILGKFMVALEPKHREQIVASLRKIGVVLNIQHEICPHHQEQAPAVPNG